MRNILEPTYSIRAKVVAGKIDEVRKAIFNRINFNKLSYARDSTPSRDYKVEFWVTGEDNRSRSLELMFNLGIESSWSFDLRASLFYRL